MKDLILTVGHNRELSPDVFELKLISDESLPTIACGQFAHLETPLPGALLRRPFCIYKHDDHSITLAIAVVGKGTESLRNVCEGERLKAILPLGNGFELKPHHRRVLLIGGGIGCAPIFSVTQCYPDRDYFSYLGFRNKESVLFESDFAAAGQTVVCTYDGSYGEKGFQIPLVERDLGMIKPDVIIACGSKPMFESVKEFSEKHGIETFVTLEERMACGVGACLGCTCKIKQPDGSYSNKRVCMDGPVFDMKDVKL